MGRICGYSGKGECHISILYAEKSKLTVRQREPTTSGSVNVCEVRFQFSPDWDGMERVAVFRAGAVSRSVLLGEDNICRIPWEVLKKPNIQLQAGVYGTRGGEQVLPTVWASLGIIQEGVEPGEDAEPPTPDLWRQELGRKADKLGYTPDGGLGLYAEDKLLNAVTVSGGAGDGWSVGHGLRVVDGSLTVSSTSDFTGDNTLPMTAAGVQAAVGNIETLLGTI